MEITVVEAEPRHLDAVLGDVRPADYKEWYAASGLTFQHTAMLTLHSDGFKRVALGEDGKGLLFWGCDEDGDVWMFATETAERKALSLHRKLYPRAMVEMMVRFGRLSALSDARNTKHHTWLQWLGFHWVRDEPFGPWGLPFKLYVKETEICA